MLDTENFNASKIKQEKELEYYRKSIFYIN